MERVTPLIAPEELAAALAAERPPVVLDVRWALPAGADRDAWLAGHIPGAAFADLDRDLAGPPGPGRHPLPDPAVFEAAMRRCGVDGDRPVVTCDGGDMMGASRAWWLLGYFGHGDVRALDGGLAAWTAAGLPLETGEVTPAPGGFTARLGGRAVLDAAGAAGLAADGVLLDVRAAARYRGEEEPIDPVAGHIPGARNAPLADLTGADGRLLPAPELRRRFEALGAGSDIGAYCGSGVGAAATVLALELAGFPAAALYVGSWSDWITDPQRPVGTGPNP